MKEIAHIFVCERMEALNEKFFHEYDGSGCERVCNASVIIYHYYYDLKKSEKKTYEYDLVY